MSEVKCLITKLLARRVSLELRGQKSLLQLVSTLGMHARGAGLQVYGGVQRVSAGHADKGLAGQAGP